MSDAKLLLEAYSHWDYGIILLIMHPLIFSHTETKHAWLKRLLMHPDASC
jgi:hypothetical protein